VRAHLGLSTQTDRWPRPSRSGTHQSLLRLLCPCSLVRRESYTRKKRPGGGAHSEARTHTTHLWCVSVSATLGRRENNRRGELFQLVDEQRGGIWRIDRGGGEIDP